MIVWTLFGCVLIALTPTASANNKIDATCNTNGANGPDWDGIADGILGFMGNIPVIGKIVGIFGNVEDIWKAAENTDDGFSNQWKICIENWVNKAIDIHELKTMTSKLATMSTKTKEQLMPIIEGKEYEKNISDSTFDAMKDTVNDIQGISDDIKETVEGGGENPLEFLIAYDAALLNELTATYLFIAKLNNITYDPNIIVDYANIYARRMREFADYLNDIDEIYLNTEKFWDDWGIKLTTSGKCDGFFTKNENNYVEYNCHVFNERNPANQWDCRGCTDFFMEYRDDCHPQLCIEQLGQRKAQEMNAKENVRALLEGMKRLVATAHNNFDGLANHHMKLTDGTDGKDCHSQCPGFNVGCLRSCHGLTAKACTRKSPCGAGGKCDGDSHKCTSKYYCGPGNQCRIENWTGQTCNSGRRCGLGGGDCDSNSDCYGDLRCGNDNCPFGKDWLGNYDDCCIKP